MSTTSDWSKGATLPWKSGLALKSSLALGLGLAFLLLQLKVAASFSTVIPYFAYFCAGSIGMEAYTQVCALQRRITALEAALRNTERPQ